MGKKAKAENEFHVTITHVGNQAASMGYARKTMTNPAQLAMWMVVRGAEDFLSAHNRVNDKQQDKDVRDFFLAVAAMLLKHACLTEESMSFPLGKFIDSWKQEMNCWENDPVKREKVKAEIKAEYEKAKGNLDETGEIMLELASEWKRILKIHERITKITKQKIGGEIHSSVQEVSKLVDKVLSEFESAKPCCVGLYSKDCPCPDKCPSLEECKEKERNG